MASLRLLPAASALLSASTSLRSVAASSGCRKISPASGAWSARPRQHDPPGIGPLDEARALAFDVIGRLRLDRIAVGEADRGLEHFGERKPAEFGEHGEDSARRPRRDRGKRPVGRRIVHALRAEELRGGPGGSHAQRIDADHLARVRVVDERLRLAAPVQHVPHRGGRGDHRAGGVHGVTALEEDLRSGGCTQRLAGDGHPLLRVKRRLLRALRMRLRAQRSDEEEKDESGNHGDAPKVTGKRARPFRPRTSQITRSFPPSTGSWAPVVFANNGPHISAASCATSWLVTSVRSTLLLRYSSTVNP